MPCGAQRTRCDCRAGDETNSHKFVDRHVQHARNWHFSSNNFTSCQTATYMFKGLRQWKIVCSLFDFYAMATRPRRHNSRAAERKHATSPDTAAAEMKPLNEAAVFEPQDTSNGVARLRQRPNSAGAAFQKDEPSYPAINRLRPFSANPAADTAVTDAAGTDAGKSQHRRSKRVVASDAMAPGNPPTEAQAAEARQAGGKRRRTAALGAGASSPRPSSAATPTSAAATISTAAAAAGSTEPGLCAFPTEVLVRVFCHLSHDCLAAVVPLMCRSWRAAAAEPLLWAHHYAARGFGTAIPQPGTGVAALGAETTAPAAVGIAAPLGALGSAMPHPAAAATGPDAAAPHPAAPPPTVGSPPRAAAPPAAAAVGANVAPPPISVDWLQAYKAAYGAACYECFRPTDRRTIGNAPLRLRLCQTCKDGFVRSTPQQRLVTATEAKYRCENPHRGKTGL